MPKKLFTHTAPLNISLHVYDCFNPLNPNDALKHHFASLKTDLIFLQPVL